MKEITDFVKELWSTVGPVGKILKELDPVVYEAVSSATSKEAVLDYFQHSSIIHDLSDNKKVLMEKDLSSCLDDMVDSVDKDGTTYFVYNADNKCSWVMAPVSILEEYKSLVKKVQQDS